MPNPISDLRPMEPPQTCHATFNRPSTTRQRPQSGRRLVGQILRWGLPLLAMFFIARSMQRGWHDIGDALVVFQGTGMTLVIGALIIEAGWTLSLAQVYRSAILAFGGHASNAQALRVSMGAFTLSRMLPGGGAVGALLAGREFTRAGNPAPLTFLALVVAGWVSLTSLALLVSIGITASWLTGGLPYSMLAVPIATLMGLGLIGIAARASLRHATWRRRVLDLVERVFSKWGAGMRRTDFESMLEGEGAIRRWRLGALCGWAATGWVLDAAALWLVFAAFDQRLDLGTLAVGYGAANLIQALPEVTPGWLGVLEGTLAMIYAGFGVPIGVGVVAVLGYRLVSFWIPVVAGIPWALSIIGGTGRRSER